MGNKLEEMTPEQHHEEHAGQRPIIWLFRNGPLFLVANPHSPKCYPADMGLEMDEELIVNQDGDVGKITRVGFVVKVVENYTTCYGEVMPLWCWGYEATLEDGTVVTFSEADAMRLNPTTGNIEGILAVHDLYEACKEKLDDDGIDLDDVVMRREMQRFFNRLSNEIGDNPLIEMVVANTFDRMAEDPRIANNPERAAELAAMRKEMMGGGNPLAH